MRNIPETIFIRLALYWLGWGTEAWKSFLVETHTRGQRRPNTSTTTMAMNGGARCLYGNKPNGNWHNAIKRLSLRLFRCSVFSVAIFAHLRAFYHTLVYLTLPLANLQTLFFWLFLFFGASDPSCLMHFNMYLLRSQIFFSVRSSCLSLSHRKLCHARILTNCKKNADQNAIANYLNVKSETISIEKCIDTTHAQFGTTFTFAEQKKRRRSSISIGICNASRKSWIRYNLRTPKIPRHK